MDPGFHSNEHPDPASKIMRIWILNPIEIYIHKKSIFTVEPLYKNTDMNSFKLQLTSDRINMVTLGEGGEQLSGGLWTQQEGGQESCGRGQFLLNSAKNEYLNESIPTCYIRNSKCRPGKYRSINYLLTYDSLVQFKGPGVSRAPSPPLTHVIHSPL